MTAMAIKTMALMNIVIIISTMVNPVSLPRTQPRILVGHLKRIFAHYRHRLFRVSGFEFWISDFGASSLQHPASIFHRQSRASFKNRIS